MKFYRSFPSCSSLEACLFVQHYGKCSSVGATHGMFFLNASSQAQVEMQRTCDSNLFLGSLQLQRLLHLDYAFVQLLTYTALFVGEDIVLESSESKLCIIREHLSHIHPKASCQIPGKRAIIFFCSFFHFITLAVCVLR